VHKKPYFISFEGIDGCGKSTQLKRTSLALQQQGIQVLETFEPGGSAGLCATIRQCLLHADEHPVAEAELLLFLADRAQHVYKVIRPALEQGLWVLCDRYSDSTAAYQLAGRAFEAEKLTAMLAFAEQGLQPDLSLWFDVPLSVAAHRLQKRSQAGEKPNRLDVEKTAFQQRVAQGFAQLHAQYPQRIQRLDAAQSMQGVQQQVLACIQQHCL